MIGNLELVNNIFIKGWLVSEDTAIPSFDLFINDSFLKSVSCDFKRDDIVLATGVDNEFNAFSLEVELNKDDVVSCRVNGSDSIFKHSPATINTEIVHGQIKLISEIAEISNNCRLIKDARIQEINQYSAGTIPFHIYEISDATVNCEGIIYVDGMAVSETLSLFNSKKSYSRKGSEYVSSSFKDSVEIDRITSFVSFGIHNYFHFIFDFIFRYLAHSEVLLTEQFFRRPFDYEFQSNFFDLFGIKGSVLLEERTAYKVSKLYFIKPLRNRFLYNKYFFEKLMSDCNRLPSSTLNYKKIYLSRLGNPNRALENESDIVELLKLYGFDIVHPEKFTIEEQIGIFSNVEFVIGPSGAALTNLIFNKSPERLKVIEICPESLKYDGSGMNKFWSSFFDNLHCESRKVYSSSLNNKENNIHKQQYILDTSLLISALTEFGLENDKF